jgi:hypothetical protein
MHYVSIKVAYRLFFQECYTWAKIVKEESSRMDKKLVWIGEGGGEFDLRS